MGFGPSVTIQLLSRIAVDGFIAGIDRSETMVQQASYRNASAIRQGQVELKHGSVSHLPYGNESFDKAFASNSYPKQNDSFGSRLSPRAVAYL